MTVGPPAGLGRAAAAVAPRTMDRTPFNLRVSAPRAPPEKGPFYLPQLQFACVISPWRWIDLLGKFVPETILQQYIYPWECAAMRFPRVVPLCPCFGIFF